MTSYLPAVERICVEPFVVSEVTLMFLGHCHTFKLIEKENVFFLNPLLKINCS